MRNPGWRRALAGGLLALGGLGALADPLAPDDPAAEAERTLARLAGPGIRDVLQSAPFWPRLARESAWRASVRRAHRGLDALRSLAAGFGALALGWGILAREPWAATLLAAGLLIWSGLYAWDLLEAESIPFLFAFGQGFNLLCLAGLWVWLKRAGVE